MAIPKIFHQTYKTKDIPERYKEYRQKLLDLHRDWEYRFYDDSDCKEIVTQHFPSFIPIYEGCATNIQRVDIFRIIAVYGMGGFYLDIDVECFNRLDDLCEFHFVLGEEITLSKEMTQKLGHRDSLRVANYMFGSEPGHPFLLHVLQKMADEPQRKVKRENDVLESTGPGLLTTVYSGYKEKFRDIVLLLNKDRICPHCRDISCHFGNYARHHHAGSWRWGNDENNTNKTPRERRNLNESQLKKINIEIESKLNKIDMPESIYVLRTYDEKPYDGLSAVFDSTRGIGILLDDTKHLRNKKILVSGIPYIYTYRLSRQNTNVVYATFESTELPSFWVGAINKHYNYCIVPHPHVKNMFETSGVNIPVEVIHQGFTRYKRIYREMKIGGIFRIGFLGVPYKRKNLFKLYQACVNLLGKIPGLRLAVHVARLYKGMYTPYLGLIKYSPFVEWTEGSLPEDDIARWYGRLSCSVFPSSGEGWSFTPRESLYMGIPTVLTDIPVHRELIESGFCRVITVCEKEDADFDGNIYGKWDRVRVEDIENSILDLYQNYGSSLIRAIEGSQWIENKWTNESSQQRILNFLNAL
jgi:glycosyltransferase involved in cell wall biosynthesis